MNENNPKQDRHKCIKEAEMGNKVKNLGIHTGKGREANIWNDERLVGHFKEAAACKQGSAWEQKAPERGGTGDRTD